MASKSTEYKIAIKIAGQVENSLKNALGSTTKGVASMAAQCAKASVAAAAALGALGLKAVDIGKEFESSMSQVAATMLIDKNTEEGLAAYQTLENAARECGATTAFSATEAAEGLNYLALAGYDADKAAAALPTVLRLAGAGAMELADASDMVTDAMSALGIEATQSNLEGFADELAKTASRSNTSVSQLGEAILTVGGTAKYLAGGTTELNTCLGLLADNGIKGSEGGTKLRNMITSLTAPTDKAADALNSLGVDVFDSSGEMRSMQSIIGDLNTAMEGMGTDKKSALLSTIFNKTDLKAVNALLGTSTERWDELSAAIADSSGACQEMYDIQLDNLEGDLAKCSSAAQDMAISAYQAMNGHLREAVQLATGWIGDLSGAFTEGGFSGIAGALGGVLSEAVAVIASYAPQFMGMAAVLLTSLISGISDNAPQIAGAASETIAVFINGIITMIPMLILLGIDLITQFSQSMAGEIPGILENGTQAIQNLVIGIIQALPSVISTALLVVQTLVNSIGQNAPIILQSAILLITNLIIGIHQMTPDILQMGIQLIMYLVQGIIQNMPLILQSATMIVFNMVDSFTQMLPMLIQSGISLVISLIQGIIQNLPNIIQAAVSIVYALAGGLITAIPQLMSSVLMLIGAIWSTIKNTNWFKVGGEIIISIGQGILDGIASIGNSIWNTLTGWFGDDNEFANWFKIGWDIMISIGQGILDGAASIGSSIWNTITGWFGGGDESADAESLGAQIVGNYTSGIGSGTGNSQAAAAANANAAMEGFSIDTSMATTYGTQLTDSYTAGITAGLTTLTDTTGTLGTSTIDTLNTSLLTGQESLTATATTLGTGFTTEMEAGITTGSEAVTAAATTAGQGTMDAMNAAMESGAVNTQAIMDGIAADGETSFSTLQENVTSATTETTDQITKLWEQAASALGTTWSSLSGKFTSAWISVHSTAVTKAQSTASAIKSAFENMSITIPRPKIPRVNVAYSTVSGGNGATAKVPNFSVSYYAAGGIMENPTAFGINPANGSTMVGGEAGAEAIVPLTELWKKMREVVGDIFEAAMKGNRINRFSDLLSAIKGEKNPGKGEDSDGDGGGMVVHYAPVYHFEGGTPTKEDLRDAEKMSQEEFNKMMEKWQKDNKRKKF